MKTILSFLRQLNENNNRDWFAANKLMYEQAKNRFEEYVEILLPKIKQIDPKVDVMSAKECTFRIYRDARFSKDKTPFKNHFGAYLVRGGKKSGNAGYYLQIQPDDNSFMGGGIYSPEPANLLKIRQAVYENVDEFIEILSDKKFKKQFPYLLDDKLQNVPRSFPKDFEHGQWLKYKSYTVIKQLKDSYLIKDNFIDSLCEIFAIQKPLNDFLNQALTE